jgi:hypothetical protein
MGMMTEGISVNAAGDLAANKYEPTVDEAIPTTGVEGGGNRVDIPITDAVIYKNVSGGYNNRIAQGRYQRWTQADNVGQDFFGAANNFSFGERLLCVGTSLNNANSPASMNTSLYGNTQPRAAFATYHETLNFRDNLCVEYPYIAPVLPAASTSVIGGGVFRFNDLYTAPIFSWKRSVRNKLINSDWGARSLPPNIDGNPVIWQPSPERTRAFTFAGAIWDTEGKFTGTAGRYWIYNDSFLTAGAANLQDVATAGNGKSTTSKFYGMSAMWSDAADAVPVGSNGTPPGPFTILITHNFTRLDPNNDAQLGVWNIMNGRNSTFLPNMRHASLIKGGKYRLSHGSDGLPQVFASFSLYNANSDGSDTVLIGIPWSGSKTVAAATVNSGLDFSLASAGDISAGRARSLTAAASLSAVNAGAGDKFWIDTTNNVLWVKHVGGLVNRTFPTDSDEDIFKPVSYRFNAA